MIIHSGLKFSHCLGVEASVSAPLPCGIYPTNQPYFDRALTVPARHFA
jgi:hypothetical protein